MMFIFLSLLELAVVGFMCRNEGVPRRVSPRRRSFEAEEFAWKEMQMPSPRIGLRQFWVDKRVNSLKNNNEVIFIHRNHQNDFSFQDLQERSGSPDINYSSSAPIQIDPSPSAPCPLPQPSQRRRQKSKLERFFHRVRRVLKNITPEKVDKYSAIMFPTAYFIFNAL